MSMTGPDSAGGDSIPLRASDAKRSAAKRKIAAKRKPAGKKVAKNAAKTAVNKTAAKARSKADGKASARTARANDNAARIQNVALNLFAKSSFSAVTIKDIGQATGLNTAMIYYYFRDKETLFQQTVEVAVNRAIAAFEARRGDHREPEAIIVNWLEIHIEQADLIRKFLKISTDYANSGKRVARIDNAIRRFYDDEHQILVDAMRAGIKDGSFRDVDVEQLSTFVSTFLDGVMARSIIFPKLDMVEAVHGLREFVLSHLKHDGA